MTCFYNPKWRNYRTPTKKDILVFRHQIKNSFPFFPMSGPLPEAFLLNIHRRVQEKFRHDGWWICNRMDYSWQFQHLGQLKGLSRLGAAWVTVLNQHSISYLFTVTHVLPVCSFGKWKCKKPGPTQPFLLHSPLWSPLESPSSQGIATDIEELRSSRHAPPSSCYRSAREGQTLLEEELWYREDEAAEKGGHGGPASGKEEEREEGVWPIHVSIPSSNDPPSLHRNGSGTQGVGVGAQNKRIIHCRSTIRQTQKKKPNRKAQLYMDKP